METEQLQSYTFTGTRKTILVIALLFLGFNLYAQPQYAYTGGTTSNSIPTSSSSNQRQILYLGSDFSTVPAGTITKIYLKSASAASFSFTNFSVKMGNTALTAMSSGPWITGLTPVFTAATFSGTPGTGNWVAITLQTPFAFSNTQNFIVEISQGGYSPGFNMLYSTVTDRSIYGTTVATTASVQARLPDLGFDFSACTAAPPAPVITTAAMTTPLCANGTKAITATNTGAPASVSYQWEQAPTATGAWTNATGGTGATTLSYTTPALTATTWYRLNATCGTFSAVSTPFQVLVSPQPSVTIAASVPNPVCANTAVTFTATPGNATSPTYQWTKNSVNVGTNSPTYTNNTWANGDVVTVTMTAPTSCQTAAPATAAPITMTVNNSIGAPGAITGSATPCPNSAATYSVAAVSGATTYNWVLPGGWTITSGAGTNSITVATASTGGTISVTAANSCGGVSTSSSLAVSPSTFVTAPGAITGNATPCIGSTQTYNVPAVTGNTYNWSVPAGWSVVTGAGTNQISVTTGANPGTISVVAVRSCGPSAPTTMAVTPAQNLTPTVTVSNTTVNNVACSGVPITFTANTVNGGGTPQFQWQRNGIATGITTGTYTLSNLTSADIISVLVTSNAPCLVTANTAATAQRIIINPSVTPGINVNSFPGTIVCTGTAVNFVSNTIGGGLNPTYQWYRNGLAINGATAASYTAATVTNADSFSVQLTSSETCPTQTNVLSNKVGVTVNPIVTPTLSVNVNPGTTIAAGQTVTFTAIYTNGGATPGFQWFKNNVAIGGATQASYSTNTLKDGDNIHVSFSSAAPCATITNKNSQPIVIRIPTGVGYTSGMDPRLQIFPNPSQGTFAIKADWASLSKDDKVKIELINTLGQRVYVGEIPRGTHATTMPVQLSESVANGVYQLHVGTADVQFVRAVLVQR